LPGSKNILYNLLRRIDIFKTDIDTNKPHIKIEPDDEN